jgi:hypothetical protein
MVSQKCWDVEEMKKIIMGGQIPLLFRDLILRGISDGLGMSQSKTFFYRSCATSPSIDAVHKCIVGAAGPSWTSTLFGLHTALTPSSLDPFSCTPSQWLSSTRVFHC